MKYEVVAPGFRWGGRDVGAGYVFEAENTCEILTSLAIGLIRQHNGGSAAAPHDPVLPAAPPVEQTAGEPARGTDSLPAPHIVEASGTAAGGVMTTEDMPIKRGPGRPRKYPRVDQ